MLMVGIPPLFVVGLSMPQYRADTRLSNLSTDEGIISSTAFSHWLLLSNFQVLPYIILLVFVSKWSRTDSF